MLSGRQFHRSTMRLKNEFLTIFFVVYLIHVLDIKCCQTGYVKAMLSKNIFHFKGTLLYKSFEILHSPGKFSTCWQFCEIRHFRDNRPSLKDLFSYLIWKIRKTYGKLFARFVTNEGTIYSWFSPDVTGFPYLGIRHVGAPRA